MFAEVVESKNEYEKFYEQFAPYLKLGIHEGSTEPRVLNTSKSGDEQVCLKEYIDRVKVGRATCITTLVTASQSRPLPNSWKIYAS